MSSVDLKFIMQKDLKNRCGIHMMYVIYFCSIFFSRLIITMTCWVSH